MTRKRLVTIVGTLVLVVVAAAAVVLVVQRDGDGDRTLLEQAMRRAPDDSLRYSWTDWAGVRREVGLDLDASSPGPALQDLLDRGFEADLTSSSALGASALVMQERLGFSPATLDWELFSQGTATASLLMKPSTGLDLDAVAGSLAAAGYEEPDQADGAWSSDPTTDDITSQVTPELLFVALDRERGFIYASDTAAGITAATEASDADESEAIGADVVAAAGQPLSASLYTGDQVCSALAMARADPTDAGSGQSLLDAAGEVNPILGFSIGADADGSVRVVMSFETEEQARTNAETRSILATGPAPGQGGDFADRFALERASVTGTVLTLDLDPVPGSYVLSDLSTGPVLFATC